MNQDDMVPLSDLRVGDSFTARGECYSVAAVSESIVCARPMSAPPWVRTDFPPSFMVDRDSVSFAISEGKP